MSDYSSPLIEEVPAGLSVNTKSNTWARGSVTRNKIAATGLQNQNKQNHKSDESDSVVGPNSSLHHLESPSQPLTSAQTTETSTNKNGGKSNSTRQQNDSTIIASSSIGSTSENETHKSKKKKRKRKNNPSSPSEDKDSLSSWIREFSTVDINKDINDKNNDADKIGDKVGGGLSDLAEQHAGSADPGAADKGGLRDWVKQYTGITDQDLNDEKEKKKAAADERRKKKHRQKQKKQTEDEKDTAQKQDLEERRRLLKSNEEENEELMVDVYLKEISECTMMLQRGNIYSSCSSPSDAPSTFLNTIRSLHSTNSHGPGVERTIADRFEMDNRLTYALVGLGTYVQKIYKTKGMAAVNEIITQLAQIPSLIKVILLLRDENLSKELFCLPIIRRVLCNKHTVASGKGNQEIKEARKQYLKGDSFFEDEFETQSTCSSLLHSTSPSSWIIEVLHSKTDYTTTKEASICQRKVINYLERISKLTILDYSLVLYNEKQQELLRAGILEPNSELMDLFEGEKHELLQKIANFKSLIPSLFVLSNEDIERASLLPIIQRALHTAVRRPFMIGVVFVDVFFHIMLLIAYKNFLLLNNDDDDAFAKIFFLDVWTTGGNNSFEKIPSDLGKFITIVFGPSSALYIYLRLILDIVAFSRLSKKAFIQNLTYRWTIIDIMLIIMMMTNVVLDLSIKGMSARYVVFQSLTLGLLWLRMLGFLQVLNRHLAAYILAIFEIIRHIWQFALVFIVLVLGFGDMFYALYSIHRKEKEMACYSAFANNDESPFCDSRKAMGYLGVYRMVVGDISYEDFNADAATTILFVVASFFIIIVIINMLIALVLESYGSSLTRSASLFGRTRVAFVTKSILLEEIFKERKTKDDNYDHSGPISRNGLRDEVLNIGIKVFAVVVFLFSNLYTIILSFTLYGSTPPGELNYEIKLILCMGSFATALLVYSITVVAVYYANRYKKIQYDHPIYKFTEKSFYYCGVVPATFVTLWLLGARREYSEKEYYKRNGSNYNNNNSDDEGKGNLDKNLRVALAESKLETILAMSKLTEKIEKLEDSIQQLLKEKN